MLCEQRDHMAKAGLGVIIQHRTVLSTEGESCESPFVSPHHIAGTHLNSYAGEASWREDHRRASNGRQAGMVCFAAMGVSVSRKWAGYWQRAA
jgi:hypothetical protein